MQSRRYLTPHQKADLREQQGDMCPLCLEPLDQDPQDPTEWDHGLALGLGGGNDPNNWAGVHRSCHKRKSAEDVRMMRKADRCRKYMETGKGRARKGRPMKSRPFDRRWRKKLNGQVERRDG